MSDTDKEEKTNASKPISRREFTKGSIAVFGAYTSLSDQEDPLPDSARKLSIEVPSDMVEVLDHRHITEDDLRRVIDHGERTGLKLYQPGTDNFMTKLRTRNVQFYVEYSAVKEGTYKVNTAYAHRFKLEGD